MFSHRCVLKVLSAYFYWNRTWTHKQLVCKRTASLAKWLSVHLGTKWLWVWVPLQSLKTLDFAPVSSKEFLDIQATIECRFTLKCVRDMIRTYGNIFTMIMVIFFLNFIDFCVFSFLLFNKFWFCTITQFMFW